MIRVAKMYHPPSGGELRGKHVPSMLILGPLGPMQKELIPALFRIAGDPEQGGDQFLLHRSERAEDQHRRHVLSPQFAAGRGVVHLRHADHGSPRMTNTADSLPGIRSRRSVQGERSAGGSRTGTGRAFPRLRQASAVS